MGKGCSRQPYCFPPSMAVVPAQGPGRREILVVGSEIENLRECPLFTWDVTSPVKSCEGRA
ncbi:MAG: hypothetical protein O6927_05980, partial [Gammaproteobacteria bacterium]|nr:hypothetical protein [Gammaproteobacteria bacterium]